MPTNPFQQNVRVFEDEYFRCQIVQFHNRIISLILLGVSQLQCLGFKRQCPVLTQKSGLMQRWWSGLLLPLNGKWENHQHHIPMCWTWHLAISLCLWQVDLIECKLHFLSANCTSSQNITVVWLKTRLAMLRVLGSKWKGKDNANNDLETWTWSEPIEKSCEWHRQVSTPQRPSFYLSSPNRVSSPTQSLSLASLHFWAQVSLSCTPTKET